MVASRAEGMYLTWQYSGNFHKEEGLRNRSQVDDEEGQFAVQHDLQNEK